MLSKERVKTLIQQSGLSQAEFARRIDYKQSSLNTFLNSPDRDTSTQLITAIHNYTGVSADYLMGFSDTPELVKMPAFPEQYAVFMAPVVPWSKLHEGVPKELDGKYPLQGYPEYLYEKMIVSIAEDDTFAPAIRPNDRVIIYSDTTFVKQNDMVLVRVNNKNMIRRYKTTSPNITILWSPSGIPDSIPSRYVDILGKVEAIHRRIIES
jgi:transcriptional regulator with XRE-family HTH domain